MERGEVALGVLGPVVPGRVRRDLSDGCVNSECAVCLERAADSALYTCGHMCMCYSCAKEIIRKPKPLCPICRQPILDVIKIFRS